MRENRPASLAAMIGAGLVAGLAGTVVMTAFQKFIEMPLTGRPDSYAPADFAEKITPLHTTTPVGRRRLNSAVHLALGALWGTAYGIAAATGLRGQRAANTVFVAVYAGDVLLNSALGLYHPRQWTTQDWAVDIVDKYVQAQATGAVFDSFLDPTRPS